MELQIRSKNFSISNREIHLRSLINSLNKCYSNFCWVKDALQRWNDEEWTLDIIMIIMQV